jgi:hypothetical protein
MTIEYKETLGEYNKRGRRSYTVGINGDLGPLDTMRNLSYLVLYQYGRVKS